MTSMPSMEESMFWTSFHQDVTDKLITISKLRHIVMMHTCDDDVLLDQSDMVFIVGIYEESKNEQIDWTTCSIFGKGICSRPPPLAPGNGH